MVKKQFFLQSTSRNKQQKNKNTASIATSVVNIAPIPGRFCIFNSKVQHTATGFRSNPRFVPRLKFVNADQQGTGFIVDKNNNEPFTVEKNFD